MRNKVQIGPTHIAKDRKGLGEDLDVRLVMQAEGPTIYISSTSGRSYASIALSFKEAAWIAETIGKIIAGQN